MMVDGEMIEVEVAYALPHKQKIYAISVERGTTVLGAAKRSPVLADFPELKLEQSKMGIFGQNVRKPDEHVLEAGDRVEIYRPLIVDPKEMRRKRAEKAAGQEAK